jgi:hypothetical protein
LHNTTMWLLENTSLRKAEKPPGTASSVAKLRPFNPAIALSTASPQAAALQ